MAQKDRRFIEKSCLGCGSTFYPAISEINRGNGKYCSRQCSPRGTKKKDPNRKCHWCSSDLVISPSKIAKSVTGKFFCSRECQSKSAKYSTDYSTGPRGSSKPTCKIDGCDVKTASSSGVCQSHLKEYEIERWIDGDNSVTLGSVRSYGPRKFVKEYLINTRGDRCESCGFDKKAPDGRSIIQLNHIDGNCTNNLIDNLELLCPNCHAMTPNYGNLNKESARSHRRTKK